MSRWVKILTIALAVSVVLNVFFVGFWTARAARHWHQRRASESFYGTIDPVPVAGETWKRHGIVLQRRREAIDAARQAVRDALVAEPFRAEALETALAKLRTETSETQAAFHAALVQVVRELSPEARRRLASSRWLGGFDRYHPVPPR